MQLKATSLSRPQSPQHSRRKPWAGAPDVMTGKEAIAEQRDLKTMGDSLAAHGMPRPGDAYMAGHIVPWKAGDARMDAIRRQTLSDWTINLDSAANGVRLPGHDGSPNASGACRGTLISTACANAVIEALSKAKLTAEALDILARIGARREQGRFPGAEPGTD